MNATEKSEMNALQTKMAVRRGLYPAEWNRLVELRKSFILKQGFDSNNFNLTNANITFKLTGQEEIDLRVKGIIPERFIGYKHN